IADACARDWDVVITMRGTEVSAKSMISVMLLAASFGSEIELFSLMPDENWETFTRSLESLFFLTDHHGEKRSAYDPVERLLKLSGKPCQASLSELRSLSASYNCGPMFERIQSEHQPYAHSAEGRPTARPPIDHKRVDAFISYDSKDFSYAMPIYDKLLERGLNVFLSGEGSLTRDTTDYQLVIEKALARTRSMIVVATDASHLEGGWVRAEWTT